jgi:hypothetical protein
MPKYDDAATAKRWRGELFKDFYSPLTWKENGYYEMLKPPHAVTFPICQGCGRVVWDWPHFEEPVDENSICETCFNDCEEE